MFMTLRNNLWARADKHLWRHTNEVIDRSVVSGVNGIIWEVVWDHIVTFVKLSRASVRIRNELEK